MGSMGNQKDTSGPVPGAYTLGQIVELAASWGDSLLDVWCRRYRRRGRLSLARFAPAILDQFPVVIVRTDCRCPRGLQARPSGLASSARGNLPRAA
jgi:hypothetical protein